MDTKNEDPDDYHEWTPCEYYGHAFNYETGECIDCGQPLADFNPDKGEVDDPLNLKD